MALKTGEIDFCTECRKWVPYKLQIGAGYVRIEGGNYEFPMTEAVCTECGAFMSPPGLMDKTISEYCDWYESKFGRELIRNR